MRAILTMAMTLLAASIIGATGCESIYEDYYNQEEKYIYLFRTESAYTGNLGGRIGADAICKTAYETYYSRLGAKDVRALINVSALDEIQDMQGNYGIPVDAPVVAVSATNRQPSVMLGVNWFDIIDETISATLASAGIATTAHWTGDGTGHGTVASSYNCNEWTTNQASPQGYIGRDNQQANAWLSSGVSACNNSWPLLCIAW
jgi:hypothetical protein